MPEVRRVAVVTGAGSGIGRAAALALAREGFAVVLAGRHGDALEATARAVPDVAARTLVVPTDVAQEGAVQVLFARATDAFGRVDVLFNNAGVFAPAASLEDVTLDEWQRVVAVNLTGAFLCAREAFKVMKAQQPQGGRIINNGSLSAYVPRPRSAAYTATKHAMTGLTRSVSLDGRPFNIACGQIDIGNARTDMTRAMAEGVPQPNGSLAVEPTIDPDVVARAIVYMATLPLDANVQFLTVMATKMPFIGRG